MKPAIVIMGLGNVGEQYVHTRHNIGFDAVDVLQQEFGQGEWKQAPKFKAVTAEARLHSLPVLLVKPTTYMNRSGESAQKLLQFYKLQPHQLLFIFDDIDIPLGEVRIKHEGSGGTHNGAKSIIEAFGTQTIPRVRLGIGPKPVAADLAGWVLSRLTTEEQKALAEVYADLPKQIEEFVYKTNN